MEKLSESLQQQLNQKLGRLADVSARKKTRAAAWIADTYLAVLAGELNEMASTGAAGPMDAPLEVALAGLHRAGLYGQLKVAELAADETFRHHFMDFMGQPNTQLGDDFLARLEKAPVACGAR